MRKVESLWGSRQKRVIRPLQGTSLYAGNYALKPIITFEHNASYLFKNQYLCLAGLLIPVEIVESLQETPKFSAL